MTSTSIYTSHDNGNRLRFLHDGSLVWAVDWAYFGDAIMPASDDSYVIIAGLNEAGTI